MKTQNKIALWLITFSIALFLFLGGIIYYFLYNYSFDDFYDRMKTHASLATQFEFEADYENKVILKLIKEQHIESLENENVNIYFVDSPLKLNSIAIQAKLPESFIKNVYNDRFKNLRKGETFYTGIKHVKNGKVYLVILSANNYYVSHHLKFMKKIIMICVCILTLFSIFLSYYFSKHIFDPIKNITNKVKDISTSNFHLRIKVNKDDNEIAQLASTFNDLLNRLETAFEVQKNFISNASHEFLTPLTAIIGEAEVLLMNDRNVQEYKDTVARILVQTNCLTQITKTLLQLANTGYRNKVIETELIRTDELIYEAKTMIDNLNPKNNILLDLSLLPENPKKLKIYGNKSLLLIALTNILTNACKYSNNELVKISVASSNESVVIGIADKGVGIPQEEMQYIYDPFFKASNAQKFDGYGIGLPLCLSIIRIMNGQINIHSIENKGTFVEIKLPIAKLKD